MFERIPSPSALRTFEAAARLKSFKKAANELGVTPTAVSHQVRTLEEALGIALFVRRTRSIDLTAAGASLAPALHAGLLGIKAALEDIGVAEKILTITATPAFAALQLAPKLAAFQTQHPEIRVQLDTGTRPVDLAKDRRVDVAIRYGFGPYPGFHAVPLVKEWFGAYCAPGHQETFSEPESARLLETEWQQPVLQNITWTAWMSAAGVGAPEDALQVIRFDEEQFVLQAAIAGQGMVLASSALVSDFLARKLLVPYRPDIRLPGASYTALCLEERTDSLKVRRFNAWLTEAFPSPAS